MLKHPGYISSSPRGSRVSRNLKHLVTSHPQSGALEAQLTPFYSVHKSGL